MNSDERECDPYGIGNCLTGRKYPNHHQPQLSRPGTALSVGTSLVNDNCWPLPSFITTQCIDVQIEALRLESQGRTESEARFEEETKVRLAQSGHMSNTESNITISSTDHTSITLRPQWTTSACLARHHITIYQKHPAPNRTLTRTTTSLIRLH